MFYVYDYDCKTAMGYAEYGLGSILYLIIYGYAYGIAW